MPINNSAVSKWLKTKKKPKPERTAVHKGDEGKQQDLPPSHPPPRSLLSPILFYCFHWGKTNEYMASAESCTGKKREGWPLRGLWDLFQNKARRQYGRWILENRLLLQWDGRNGKASERQKGDRNNKLMQRSDHRVASMNSSSPKVTLLKR